MNISAPCRVIIVSSNDTACNTLVSALRHTDALTLTIEVVPVHWPTPLPVKSQPVDLVVIIESPALSLPDIIGNIRPAGSRIPVVVASAEQSHIDKSICKASGASDVIPAEDVDRLLSCIEQHLRLQRESRQRQLLARQLSCMEKRQLALIDHCPHPVALITPGTHLYCNGAYESLFGTRGAHLAAMPPPELLAPKSREQVQARLGKNPGEQLSVEVSANTARGNKDLVLAIAPSSYRGAPCWLLDYKAPAGNREYAREKRENAGLDLLTRLENQSAFMARVESAIASAINDRVTSTLLVTRIDHFRKLRETIGHAATNQVIQDILSFLRQAIDKPYTASRLAEDEFGLLLFGSAPEPCLPLADFIRSKVNNCLDDDSAAKGSISTSVGILAINDQALDAEDMINRARINSASTQGMAGLEGFEELENNKVSDADIETLLREALEKQNFSIRFQPMLALRDESLQCHEAQVSLPMNGRQALSAARFLSRANVLNLAEQVDRQVLTAILANTEFRQQHDTRLYIQPGSNSLVNKTFLSWLARQARQAPALAGRLVFQVSEPDLHASRESVQRFCHGLEELGIARSITRFGCAMEPLTAIKAVAPISVTLDETLVRDILYSQQQMRSVRKLVNALHHKSVLVAASGIEDPDMLVALWELGLDFVQGSCLQPPLDSPGFTFPVETGLPAPAEQLRSL